MPEDHSVCQYKVVSLFSGAMGLDIGFETTGRFKLIACVENNHACCNTIRQNKADGRLDRNLILFERDIRTLTPEEVLEAVGLKRGEVDVLIGGPPCQAFSTAGKRQAVQDPRGTLLWQFLRFVEGLNPRFFVMENVRGLLSAALKHRPLAIRPSAGGKSLGSDEQAGSVVEAFANDLQHIDGGPYHMDCFEVNAVNYGAPQIRERVIFIGNRYNLTSNFPDPTHGAPESNSKEHRSMFEGAPSIRPWSTLRTAIGSIHDPTPELLDFSPRKKEYLNLVPAGSNWRSLPEPLQKESMGKAWHAKGGRSGWWRRLTFDLPCPTLVTMPNHASTSLCHPTQTRALSLREYACIQEFPEDWVFVGTVAEKYAQAGNAVPIRLGRVAGGVVAEQLDTLRKRNWQRDPFRPESYRIIYVQSHVRTRRWFKNGQPVVWDSGTSKASARYGGPKTKRKAKKLNPRGSQLMSRANPGLPKAGIVGLSKTDILGILTKIDTKESIRKRVLAMETDFRKWITNHLKSLNDDGATFDDFGSSPFVLLIYAALRKYSRVSEIELDILPAKLFSSMETSAGKMIETVALPHYGWSQVPSGMHSANSAIDGKMVAGGVVHIATLKSGPVCLNDEMSENFADAVVQFSKAWADEANVKKVDFTYGVLYGTPKQSNKKDWHILRKISEKLPKDACTVLPNGRWDCSFAKDGVDVSATVRIGLDWWTHLGGETCLQEVLVALIRACVKVGATRKVDKYEIQDLGPIVSLDVVPEDYNVSLLQRSQLEWLFFMMRHFCDVLTD